MVFAHFLYCKGLLDYGQARRRASRMRVMKVAIVHDDLVQWGGAERVLLAISEVFPEAPIYTSVFNRENEILLDKFKDKKIITSFIERIPFWKDLYRSLLLLYPIAFEQFDFSEYDLVISQTTRFAKSIITKPGTTHICYCHTPPRFLWNFSSERVALILAPFLTILRLYDQVSAHRVDRFLAGSKNAQQRIKKIYHRESQILYPFVDLDESYTKGFDGGYYLMVARLNHYKRLDIAIEVFNKRQTKLKIVGVGRESNNLQLLSSEGIEFMGSVTDDLLKQLLLGCRGLIVTAEEDFGMAPLEAQALGKGVIAYGAGGSLETVVDGKTGVLFGAQTPESLDVAISKYERIKINPQNCYDNARQFSLEKFKNRLKELSS